MEIAITIFSAFLVFCISYIVLYYAGSNRRRVKERINRLLTKDHENKKPDKKNNEEQKDKSPNFGSRLSSDLEAAGILLRANEYLLIWAATTIVPAFLFFIAGGDLISVIAVLIIGFIIPPLLVNRSKRLRIKKFEKQLADSIVFISNSLRAGFTFQQAMESVSKEMPDPIASEFKRTLLEIKLGAATEDAMERMVLRTKSNDLSLLVSAVLIQWKAGGNLSDVLDNISGTIRDRLRIKGQIRVITSSGRISGIIIGLLPIFLVAILMIINPSYIKEFFSTSIGVVLIFVAIIMEVFGFIVIKKIIDIKM